MNEEYYYYVETWTSNDGTPVDDSVYVHTWELFTSRDLIVYVLIPACAMIVVIVIGVLFTLFRKDKAVTYDKRGDPVKDSSEGP